MHHVAGENRVLPGGGDIDTHVPRGVTRARGQPDLVVEREIVVDEPALARLHHRQRRNLESRAEELDAWIGSARSQEAAAAAWLASEGSQATVVEERISSWLRSDDSLATRNLILRCASLCGLHVSAIRIDAIEDPLSSDSNSLGAGTILGVEAGHGESRDADDPTDLVALPLAAERYVVEGTGSLSSLLMFCGVLPEMPTPLRLRSLTTEEVEGRHTFRVAAEKLCVRPEDDEQDDFDAL